MPDTERDQTAPSARPTLTTDGRRSVPLTQEALAVRLRQAVEDSGVSQRTLAERLDLDESAVSRMLSGERRVSSLELARFAQATDVSVGLLLWGSEDVERFADDVKAGARIRLAHEIADALETNGYGRNVALFVRGFAHPVRCRHCGDVGPAGTDHTCPCPNRDGECAEHPDANNGGSGG